MREAQISRKTNETNIFIKLNIDGRGNSAIDSGCGFLNHMLTLFARHARFDLEVKCEGDTDVDYHHTVEDIGIALGAAVKQCLGNMTGITRYGNFILPMDEALILTAVDISGRGMLVFDLDIPTEKIGEFDSELVEEFFIAFARNSNITIHIKKLNGKNSHHIAEGAFKSIARSMKTAVSIDTEFADEIPSTKGVL